MTDSYLLQQQQQRTNLNTSSPPLIMAIFYPGAFRPYFEVQLRQFAERYNPAALIVIGEDVRPRSSDLGQIDLFKNGFDTNMVQFPIVHTTWEMWTALGDLLANGTTVIATVTDLPENPWHALRISWWFPFWMTVSIVWAAGNSSVCIFLLSRLPRERTLAFVIISLELASNLMRLPFLTDPFGGWWIPIALVNVFYSMSWPIHIASSVIVVFFWIELISSSDMTASGGFITSRRWHAAICIVIVIAVEFSISASRAAVTVTSELLLITAATYLVILIILAVTYFYVYAQVRKFFSSLVTLKSNDKLILKVSIRFLFTAFSFVALILMGILTSLPLYDRAIGQSLVHAFVNWTIDAGSTCTIAAFYGSVMANYKSRKSASTKHSSSGPKSSASLNP